jgi:phenylacetate-coenzyme A ligase PaaK-like adenylate-forming protein
MNKKTYMEHFDEIVTDPRLRLSQLKEHMAHVAGDEYYLGEYRVLTTAGSSGQKTVIVFNRREWSIQEAASMRIASMMGVVPFSTRRPKIVTIGSPSPLHDSYRLPLSMDIGLYRYHVLPATAPIDELVQRLNLLQPYILRGFPSMLGLLVTEQLQGRLHINPCIVAGGGEPLSKELRKQLQAVWQSSVFDIYGTQEGLRAMECNLDEGMHIFEDLGIVEVVDEDNRPVPDGPARVDYRSDAFLPSTGGMTMCSIFKVEQEGRLPFILSIFGMFWRASRVYGSIRWSMNRMASACGSCLRKGMET